MASPTINSLSLDKIAYAPAGTARLAFDVPAVYTESVVTVTVTDSTGATGTGEITLAKRDELSVTVSDPDRTWTKDEAASTDTHYEFTSFA